MRTLVAVTSGGLLAAAVAAAPLGYKAFKDNNYRNLQAVEPGTLYRSGQLTPAGRERVVREFGIRTIVSLRDSYDESGPPPDQEEEAYCRANGLAYFRVKPRPWSAPNGSVPAEEGVREFLAVMDRRADLKPILVHCFAGIHRTGTVCSIYRMEYNGWSAADAIREMKAVDPRRATFEKDVLRYLEDYPTHRSRLRPLAVGTPGGGG